MNLARLQELTNLVESTSKNTAANLNEGRSTMSDFDGIRSIVEDALGDLSDKLGKSGSLAALMKSSGAAKLDTVKDADGKNIQAQIVAKTVEYRKAMEKLLMEAEMLQKPDQWKKHYSGPDRDLFLQRHFSLSDRIRYYWPAERPTQAVADLLARLENKAIPAPVLHQFFPHSDVIAKSVNAKMLLKGAVKNVLRLYDAATNAASPS